MKLVDMLGIRDFFSTQEWIDFSPIGLTQAHRIAPILQIFTIFIGFFLISFISRAAKQDKVLKSFIFMNLSMMIWTAGLLLENVAWSRSFFGRFAPIWVSYLGVCSMGLSWLVFCMYLSESPWIQKRKNKVLLFILPTLFYILVLTNHWHNFMYVVPKFQKRSFAPGYYLLVLTVALYIVIGLILLLKSYYRRNQRTRYQTFFLALIASVIFLTLIGQFFLKWDLETKPLTFVVMSSLFFYIGSVRYQFFSIIPAPFEVLIQVLDDGVLILDPYLKIRTFNRAMNKIIHLKGDLKENAPVQSIVDYLQTVSKPTTESHQLFHAMLYPIDQVVNAQLTYNDSFSKTFKVSLLPVKNKKGELLAKVIIFTDITKFSKLSSELERKNNEILEMNQALSEANDELLRQSLMLEEHAETSERNRILRELYQAIEETFKKILRMTMSCKEAVLLEDPREGSNLKELIQVTKDGLNEIRKSIYYQKNISNENNCFKNTLEKLFKGKFPFEMEVFFEGLIIDLPYHIRHAVYIACRETLENSASHGKATLVYIILQFNAQSLDVIITDNGKGCEHLNKGTGLSKIESLCIELRGNVRFGSPEENQGFSFHMALPLE
jgi:signal transduction histidine kinase